MYRRIDTGSRAPVFAKPRKLSTEKYNAAQAEFKNLQSNGISPSDSELARKKTLLEQHHENR